MPRHVITPEETAAEAKLPPLPRLEPLRYDRGVLVDYNVYEGDRLVRTVRNLRSVSMEV